MNKPAEATVLDLLIVIWKKVVWPLIKLIFKLIGMLFTKASSGGGSEDTSATEPSNSSSEKTKKVSNYKKRSQMGLNSNRCPCGGEWAFSSKRERDHYIFTTGKTQAKDNDTIKIHREKAVCVVCDTKSDSGSNVLGACVQCGTTRCNSSCK
jgi:hypothetical protein